MALQAERLLDKFEDIERAVERDLRRARRGASSRASRPICSRAARSTCWARPSSIP